MEMLGGLDDEGDELMASLECSGTGMGQMDHRRCRLAAPSKKSPPSPGRFGRRLAQLRPLCALIGPFAFTCRRPLPALSLPPAPLPLLPRAVNPR
ncbi:unnamed protein product [Coccothraustes coccothraustes]